MNKRTELLKRLRAFAKEKDLVLQPNKKKLGKTLDGLLYTKENYCPCIAVKQETSRCPCKLCEVMVANMGNCVCELFFENPQNKKEE